MAAVLAVYAAPYAPTRPQVNCDEPTTQRINATRQPRPAQPGRPQRYAEAYERHGTRHLVRVVEPPAGWRHVQVTAPRTTLDVAYAMPWLVDEGSPEATVLRVVLDKLHTPQLAALDEAFEPAEARRMARKLAVHDTPKQGSGLNMAEID